MLNTVNQMLTEALGPLGPLLALGFLGVVLVLIALPAMLKKETDGFAKLKAQAQAAKIYATSFGKDPAFYDFYRAMQSYDATFSNTKNNGQSTIILSPDNEYLRQFRGR